MSKKQLQAALEDPLGQVRRSRNNMLGQMYWTLVNKLGITLPSFTASLDKYVRNARNVPVQSARKRSEKTSNLTSEITNPDRLTWPKLIEAFKAIEITRVRIKIEVWRGRRKIHAETILDKDLADFELEETENGSTEE